MKVLGQAAAKLLMCRRSIMGLTGIVACVIISQITKQDTSGAISLLVASIAGANAWQGINSKKEST